MGKVDSREIMRSLGVIFLFLALAGQAAESPAGRWEGATQIPGRDLPLVIDLAKDGAGKWSGSVILPGFGVKGAPLSDIKVNLPELSFKVSDVLGGIAIQGRLTANDRVTGEFQQGGNKAPLALKRTGPAQVELAAVSTRVTSELEGEWKGNYELGGYPRYVTLRFANQNEGAAKVEFIIVGKRTNNIPVDLITQEENYLVLQSRPTQITVEGRYRKETEEIKAMFQQGPFEAPLVLRRPGK
jgi:hypothetical protein